MNATEPTLTVGENEFTVVRVFHAPIDLVFDTMTDPAHLTHFWGPTGTSTPLEGIVVEPHVGGRFETLMVDDESGQEFPMEAVYVEFERPTKLAWRANNLGILASSTFRDLGDGTTEVTVHQTDVPSDFLTEEGMAGFMSSLDKGEAYLQTLLA
jgi:uncharacterized protein YndB with AHSA1/START domain